MNISQPVSSVIDSVEFAFLSADEIRSISVKRVENESTFDTLLNPVPGGLYDPALGSWGDSLCATCHLGQAACPGHAGHIDLPSPVYHPLFMDQVLRLLRARCCYCNSLRLGRREVHRYICKLRLLQHGLVNEAQMIDAVGEDFQGLALEGVPQDVTDEAEEEDAEESGVIRARNIYVRQVLKLQHLNVRDLRRGKHEGALASRRDLVKSFLADITKGRKCIDCQGISPGYRKDRFVKIFEKTLSPKEKAQMVQGGRKSLDVLSLSPSKRRHSQQRHVDEAIADVDLASTDDEAEYHEEDHDMAGPDDEAEGESLDEHGELVTSAKKKPKADLSGDRQRFVSPKEVMDRLNGLFRKEQEIVSLLYNSRPRPRNSAPLTADMFFIKTLLVPPNRYRPEARMGDAQVSEAQQNSLYKMVLRSSNKFVRIWLDIRAANEARGKGLADEPQRPLEAAALYEAWSEMQECVNSLIDRDKNPIQGAAGKRNEEGIKQKLEKKEGLFRKNMMGKRVNYAARSVISPDPYIETNEIGVPPVFAKKLTYPEPVTSHNFKDLQQAVINGIEKWPGAAAIENENGTVISLRAKSLDDRLSLANQLLTPANTNFSGMRNKKVHRHLSNGDVVLMNRQPTLHKPSIMGHRVRVLPGEKTIRMHYANCNTYNADFDGDEMNMHFPQNEIARAEALGLADTDHQYLSGTQGKPLRGLIQDHISLSVALCNKDTFFDRSSYHQLVYGALRPENGHILRDRIELVPPALFKPAVRWTGKQVITTILKNIRPEGCDPLWMKGKTQIPSDRWGSNPEDGVVLFCDGEFISGILDKSQLGPSSGGLIHAVHEVYGPAVAGKVLSGMGRLLTRFLNMRAFSCGMDDLGLQVEVNASRHTRLEAAKRIGLEVAAKYVGMEDTNPQGDDPELLSRLEEVMRDDSKQEGLDILMNQACSGLSGSIIQTCLPAGLVKQFPHNQMQVMTSSGAKGGAVNASLISCNLGQQVLEGRRVPLMVSGKSLPSFHPYDTDVRAGGYVVSRFLTGIRPQEYYFHHMAGREGLIDTAVKTSRSGYLQRCLIKGMEGLEVAYDSSVRDADGTMVQFLYGEDGLDVTKQKYLGDFGFLLRNLDSQLQQINFGEPGAHVLFEHKDNLVKRIKSAIKSSKGPAASVRSVEAPVNCSVNPARYAFATSEKFFGALQAYVKANPDGLLRDKDKEADANKFTLSQRKAISRKTAEKILAAKYARSLVEPGEAVGIVAGQSVGEPSTQMTLNTFHLAGHSAKNVTLGIPRLREILMTASASISTPAMTLSVRENVSNADAESFARSISVLPLSHVVEEVQVAERIEEGISGHSARVYTVSLRFFSSSECRSTYAVESEDIMDAVETKFLPALRALMAKDMRKDSGNHGAVPDIGVKAGNVEVASANHGAEMAVSGEDADSDDDDQDGDATNAKQKANRSEAISYGPNDEEDEEIQDRMRREASPVDDREEPEDEAYGGSPPASGDEQEDQHKIGGTRSTRQASRAAAASARAERVLKHNELIGSFECDEAKGEWCRFSIYLLTTASKLLMLNLVRKAIHKAVVRQIGGLGACTFVAEAGDDNTISRVVHTVGSNLRAAQQFGSSIDINRISTNDIVSMLHVYGVEACRSNIIRELRGVFSGHGIGVDPRHLNVIGDYMTRNGGFTPFNRAGLTGNVSPFTKMSFETTLAFLKDAALDGDWDDLTTPSGRLVMGRLGRVGTGAFDVVVEAPMQRDSRELGA